MTVCDALSWRKSTVSRFDRAARSSETLGTFCRDGRPWFVYFIECRNGSIYTGMTHDVSRRFDQHVAGKGARFTRMHPPVRLLGFFEVDSKGAALSAELRFKQLSATRKRKWIDALNPGGSPGQ